MINDDRRIFPRHTLRAFAELGSSNQQWAAHVLDISHQGARIALLDDYHLPNGSTVKLRIEIPESHLQNGIQPYLLVEGTLVHQQEHILGIQYQPGSEADAELLNNLLANLNQ